MHSLKALVSSKKPEVRQSPVFTTNWCGKDTSMIDDLNDDNPFDKYKNDTSKDHKDIYNHSTDDEDSKNDTSNMITAPVSEQKKRKLPSSISDSTANHQSDETNTELPNHSSWTEEADRELWEKHTQGINNGKLALLYNRSIGAIKARIGHLKDPQHAAYMRLKGIPNNDNSKISLDFSKKKEEKSNNKINAYITKMKKEQNQSKLTEQLKNQSSDKVEIDPDAQISLSQSQFRVLKTILLGKSVFYTGAAGTGKSYILKVFQDVMEYCKRTSSVYLTAPTGVAACNIGGQTIHAWAGIGQYLDHRDENFINQIGRSNETKGRWTTAEILVIDEISMLSAEVFDALNTAGKRVRSNNDHFGGIQIVVCGDFFQLPPIGVNSREVAKKTNYCFNSEVWGKLFSHSDGMIVLDKVFRQKEQQFLDMLNELRRGIITDKTHNMLQNKCNKTAYEEQMKSREDSKRDAIEKSDESIEVEIIPTKLFPTNKDVEITNERELNKLPGEVEVYHHTSEGLPESKRQLLQGMKSPQILELKVGAQVMLLKNLDVRNGFVNGTRGTIVGFTPPGEDAQTFPDGGPSSLFSKRSLPIVRFEVKVGNSSCQVEHILKEASWELKSGERVLATFTQIPLMLAWAISIHKSQGMTITNLEVSFSGMFEFGQAYVSLSRATDFEKLKLKGYQRYAIKCSREVLEFYTRLGYNKETFHKDDATVHTTIKELGEIYNTRTKITPPKPENDGWMDAKENFTSISKESKAMASSIYFGISKHQGDLMNRGNVLPISQNQREIMGKNSIEARTVVNLSDDEDEQMTSVKCEYTTPMPENNKGNAPIASRSNDSIAAFVNDDMFTSPNVTLKESSQLELTEAMRIRSAQNKAAALEKLEKRRKMEQSIALNK